MPLWYGRLTKRLKFKCHIHHQTTKNSNDLKLKEIYHVCKSRKSFDSFLELRIPGYFFLNIRQNDQTIPHRSFQVVGNACFS